MVHPLYNSIKNRGYRNCIKYAKTSRMKEATWENVCVCYD